MTTMRLMVVSLAPLNMVKRTAERTELLQRTTNHLNHLTKCRFAIWPSSSPLPSVRRRPLIKLELLRLDRLPILDLVYDRQNSRNSNSHPSRR